MKLLHTADLHIGKRVLERSMIEDVHLALEEILEIARDERVDGVLIAGDVYDRPVPPVEAVELFSSFLLTLAKEKIPVFLIAGNHDSPERLAFCGEILDLGGIHAAGVCRGAPKTVVLEREERVAIHMVSFARTAALRPFAEKELNSAADAMGAVLEKIDFTVADRHILLAHAFVAGGMTSDSEINPIGTAEALPADLFRGFDYVALGHLHGPQTVADGVRYAGSPLKYSFSEKDHRKSVTLLELLPNTPPTWREIPLHALRDMREVRGELASLLRGEYSEDYIRAVVTDTDVPPDARLALQTVYPNLLRFAVENQRTLYEEEVAPAEGVERRDPLSLFAEFYEMQNGIAPDAARLALMGKLLCEEVEE
ncbi:MAG: exonuclease SbcCD subunit D [Ruminococcaceae bacterium]|nr:exonuclease SbcCD subunit D [Oscillospiraceae bacterium]